MVDEMINETHPVLPVPWLAWWPMYLNFKVEIGYREEASVMRGVVEHASRMLLEVRRHLTQLNGIK
jgi:hypothetical protein